ncbi:hypothetical protein QBE53_10430 [Vallitaleaceae bacterium 9-2]
MKKIIIILIAICMLMGCSTNDNYIQLKETKKEMESLKIAIKQKENELLKLKDDMKNTTLLVEKLQNEVNISEEESYAKGFEYTICEAQPLESKAMLLKKSNLYSAPNMGAEIIEENIEGRVLVLYEVSTESGRWAYVKLQSKDVLGISPYGFVTSDLLNHDTPEVIIDHFSVSEDISIGMTFSEMKLLFGNNYIVLEDFYGDSVVFYFNEERYKHEVKRYATGVSNRESLENALICKFTFEFQQLSELQITSPHIKLISGISVGDSYQEVKTYCDVNYSEYTDSSYIFEKEKMLVYQMSEKITVIFGFDEPFGELIRIDIKKSGM